MKNFNVFGSRMEERNFMEVNGIDSFSTSAFIDEVIEAIEKSSLSVMESITYAYQKVVEVSDNDFEKSIGINAHQKINIQAFLFSKILDALSIPNNYISVRSNVASNEDKTETPGNYASVVADVKDEHYGVDGFYLFAPSEDKLKLSVGSFINLNEYLNLVNLDQDGVMYHTYRELRNPLYGLCTYNQAIINLPSVSDTATKNVLECSVSSLSNQNALVYNCLVNTIGKTNRIVESQGKILAVK